MKSVNSCPANRKKNSKGLKKIYALWLKSKNNFSAAAIIKSNENAIKSWIENNLKKGSSLWGSSLKQRIQKHTLLEYKCNNCNLEYWLGKRIVLELDHINWNNSDNRLENLRYLCPNCHSLTPTFRGRNINTGKIKVLDSDILDILNKNEGISIRQVLIKCWLSPKWANYGRIYKIILKNK